MTRVFQPLALAIAIAAGQTAAGVPLRAAPDSQQALPDNTKVNKDGAPTAEQQGASRTDLETSRQIRKAIVGDKTLSTYAHNIKVITRNGQVTLKGPVRSSEEQAAVQAKAAEVAGPANVVNQTAVVASKTPTK